MTTAIKITEDAFAALFPLRTNYLNPGASWQSADGQGCLFETSGDEFEYVEHCDPRHVWTLVDDDGSQYVLSGFHHINRIGYLVSATPVPEGVEIRVDIPNRPRTERLALFSKAIACYPDFDPATNLVDLLADAMHWSSAGGVSFEQALKTAKSHFTNETAT